MDGLVKKLYVKIVVLEIFYFDMGKWSSKYFVREFIYGECYEWLGLDEDDDDYDEFYFEGWLDFNMLGLCIFGIVIN